jgi:putative hydrolase of the HAD superfamily
VLFAGAGRARRYGGAGRTVAPGVERYGVRVTRAPLSLPGRTVIFDYGEVISLTPSKADRAVIAALAGVGEHVAGETADAGEPGLAADRFWAAYFAHRDGLDQGTADVAAYWRAIAAEVGARWDEGRVHELWAADFRSWLSVNPGTVDVLADLRAGGTPLALLSNAGPDFGSYFRHGPLRDFFSAFYVSGELGLIKPQAAIYQHALDDLAITPAEAVFIDNRAPNVAGAEALGITGHVFTDADRLREFLTSLAVSACAS